jgi:hypothetical protein
MRSVIGPLDRSPRIKSLIKWLSSTLAAQRGLPVMGALFLTVFSLVVHLAWAVTGNVVVGICGFLVLHLAIFIGFLGVLLAEPLGRG